MAGGLLRSALRRCATAAPATAPAASVPKGISLKTFSPFLQKQLRFDDYPKKPWKRTVGGIVAVNVLVWFSWLASLVEAESGDETKLNFMRSNFMGTNQGMSELVNWHRIWTSSVSHQSFSHILGNMTAFLFLAPRLVEFLGWPRFLLLYGMGAAGGTLATQALHLDPTWEKESVAVTPKRYFNILSGNNPGEAVGLGASDAIAAMFAVFYLTFPRQNVPFLGPKINIAWRHLIPDRWKQGSLYWIDRTIGMSKGQAIWVLPAFFLADFTNIFGLADFDAQSGLVPATNTGHAAHVGGFLAGTVFYALVAHPLKSKYFVFTASEAVNRVWIMGLSLTFWYSLMKWSASKRAEKRGVTQKEDHGLVKKLMLIRYRPDSKKLGENKQDSCLHIVHELWQTNPQLQKIVKNANACSAMESCRQHLFSGHCDQCDKHFVQLRKFFEANTNAPTTAGSSLGQEMVNSMVFCRELMWRWNHNERQCPVHDDYRAAPPPMQRVVLPGSMKDLLSVDPLLREAGFVCSFEHDKDQEGNAKPTGRLWLRRVRRDSFAEKEGYGECIGDTITAFNSTVIKTKKDFENAKRNSSNYLWLVRDNARRKRLEQEKQKKLAAKAEAKAAAVAVTQAGVSTHQLTTSEQTHQDEELSDAALELADFICKSSEEQD